MGPAVVHGAGDEAALRINLAVVQPHHRMIAANLRNRRRHLAKGEIVAEEPVTQREHGAAVMSQHHRADGRRRMKVPELAGCRIETVDCSGQ